MNERNALKTVSCDQNSAVRCDGKRLVAVRTRYTFEGCRRCHAQGHPIENFGCTLETPGGRNVPGRFCTRYARKDGQDVFWAPAEERK